MKDLKIKKGELQEELEKELDKAKENKDRSIQNKWKTIKEVVKNEAKKLLGFQKEKLAKKPWITDKMMKKMDERRT